MVRLASSLLLLSFSLVSLSTHSQEISAYRTVLLAAHRAGRIEVLDPIKLHSLGSIKIFPQASTVTSDRTGILFVNAGIAPEFQGCCALYAVDLDTRKVTKLLEPVGGVAISPDGHHLLAQRGNVGIEEFTVPGLQREPWIPRSVAPGVYNLSFSPDGRRLFGVSNDTMSLDILDFDGRKLVQRFAVPQDLIVLGTWVRDTYYLYGYRDRNGQLWRANGGSSTLEGPVKTEFPDPAPDCKLQVQELLGVGGRLFLYELFGTKFDRRSNCSTEVPGGFFSIDQQNGALSARMAPEFHFASLISDQDGKELYGIDVKDATWTSVGLVRLNATSGDVLSRLDLTSDVWFITLVTVPADLVPRGEIEPKPSAVISRRKTSASTTNGRR